MFNISMIGGGWSGRRRVMIEVVNLDIVEFYKNYVYDEWGFFIVLEIIR